jgi:hypothetical protein
MGKILIIGYFFDMYSEIIFPPSDSISPQCDASLLEIWEGGDLAELGE